MDRITAAKELTQKLLNLLSDPEPGLLTWHEAVMSVKRQLDRVME